MVGIVAFRSEYIKKKTLVKSLKGLTVKLCKECGIDINDIGLIVHTGMYAKISGRNRPFPPICNRRSTSDARTSDLPVVTFFLLTFSTEAVALIMHWKPLRTSCPHLAAGMPC